MNRTNRTHRIIASTVTTLAALAVMVPGASAASTVECVGFVMASAPGDCTTLYVAGGLQLALDAVQDADADIVRIAPGFYNGSFTLASAHGDRIIGSGIAQTLLQNATATGATALTLTGAQAEPIEVSDLAIGRPSGTSGSRAVAAAHVVLERVELRATNSTGVLTTALDANDVRIVDSSIEVGGTAARAVYAHTGDVTIEHSSIAPLTTTTGTAVSVDGPDVHAIVRRTSIGDPGGSTSFEYGLVTPSGAILLVDSLVDMGTRFGARGVVASSSNGMNPTQLIIRRSTIVGTGTVQWGVYGSSIAATGPLETTIEDSVIDLTGTGAQPVRCLRSAAGVVNAFELTGVAFDAPVIQEGLSCGAVAARIVDTHAIPSASMFINPGSHDFRPLPSGPLVDAGTPLFASTTLDLAGAARVQDGDANGKAVLDLGAYEAPTKLQPVPPNTGTPGGDEIVIAEVSGDTTRPTVKLVGPAKRSPFLRTIRGAFGFVKLTERRAFQVTSSETASGKLTLARKVGKRFVALKGGQSLRLTRGARRIGWTGKWQGAAVPAGTYRVTIVATDAAGNVSTPRSLALSLVKEASTR